MSANPAIFELDYESIKNRCLIYKDELMKVALHPSRIEKYLSMGIELEDLEDYL